MPTRTRFRGCGMDALCRGREAFANAFGCEPRWIASAPGRVNLIGEHTDYNEGWVLPIAIDRRTVVCAGPARAPDGRALALELEAEAAWPRRPPFDPVGSPRWLDYVLGVARGFQDRGFVVPPLDLVIASDVPVGAGLSSSAALEVAMAALLEVAIGIELPGLDRVRLCRTAEHTFPGTPCGIMDMFIASEARAGHAVLIDCRDETGVQVPFPGELAAVLVVDSGLRHDLADGAYRARADECSDAACRLGVPALRDIDDPEALVGLPPMLARRARHVIEENRRTRGAASALADGDLGTFGRALTGSHESLRDLFEVSCPELDLIVEASSTCPGVFGARMTGAGFGGSGLVLCAPTEVRTVARTIVVAFERRFGRAPDWFVTAPDEGACAHR